MSEQNQVNESNTANAEAEAPKLTRREKLAARYEKLVATFTKVQAELQELVDEINAIDSLASVDVGTTVYVRVGKGETSREVQGVVIGVREDEDGAKQYKVQYGQGFDADVKIVSSRGLRLQPTPVAEVAEAPAAE